MTVDTLIEVAYKKGAVDPVAYGLSETLRHWEGPKPKRIVTAQLYRLQGSLSSTERSRIARDLLCDPVIQEFTEGSPLVNAAPARKGAKKKREAAAVSLSVDVWYKSGVTDVAGSSVLKAIHDLSIRGASDVRTGMRYQFWGLKTKEAAQKVAVSYLANPLVQDILIHADY